MLFLGTFFQWLTHGHSREPPRSSLPSQGLFRLAVSHSRFINSKKGWLRSYAATKQNAQHVLVNQRYRVTRATDTEAVASVNWGYPPPP